MRTILLKQWKMIVCIMCMHQVIPAQQTIVETEVISDSTEMHVAAHPVLIYASGNRLPFAVSEISRIQITSLKEPIVEPLLNSTPGVWMQSGTLNTNRISIRGVGYREPFATTGVKVYLDEIPLTNGVGETSIEDIHPLILSGIEVLRGPASALWGAGLGGMVLLKSDTPDSNTLSTRIQAGSYGRLQTDQHLSLKYGKRDQWGTAVHYQYLNDDGFRDNNHYRKYSMTWMQHWRNDHGWTVQSFLHGIALKAFIPSSVTFADYTAHPERAAPTWAAVMGNEDYTKWITGLTFGYSSTNHWVYRGSVFGTWFASDEVRPFNILDESNTAFGTRHRVAWQVQRAGRVTAGMEFYRERYNASTFETLPEGKRGLQLSDEQDQRSYLHVFCQSEWNVGKHGQIFAGLSSAWSRLANVSLSTDVPASLYPAAGLHYALSPFISVSASVSRGYTALSLSNVLNSDGSIQSEIKPETGWSKEVSVHLNKDKNISASITGYFMHISNTIITRRLMDDVFEKYNGGKTLHRGVEAELNLCDNKQHISWKGAYTFNAHVFSEFNDGGVDFSGKALPGIPKHRLFQTLALRVLPALYLSFNHHWVSEVYLNDANTLRGSGYHLINSSVDYRFKTSEKWKWVISAHLHNILDTDYSPMFQINAPGGMPRYYYPGKPRSLYVSVGFQHDL